MARITDESPGSPLPYGWTEQVDPFSGKIFHLNLETEARLDRRPTANDADPARHTSPPASPHVRFTPSTVTSPVSQYSPEKDKALLEGPDKDAFAFGNRRALSQSPIPSRSSMKSPISRPLPVPVDISSPSSPKAPTSPYSPFDFDVASVARRLGGISSPASPASERGTDLPSRTSSMSPPRRDVSPYAELQAQLNEARRREAQLRIELDRARLDQAHERIAHLEYRLDMQARELEDNRYGDIRASQAPSHSAYGTLEDDGRYEAGYASPWGPASYHGPSFHAAPSHRRHSFGTPALQSGSFGSDQRMSRVGRIGGGMPFMDGRAYAKMGMTDW